MKPRTFRFQIEIPGDVSWDGVLPIYDEYETLAGGFTVFRGNVIWGFVGGDNYPVCLLVSGGSNFWFTSKIDTETGQITGGIISEVSLGCRSIRVTGATEVEND